MEDIGITITIEGRKGTGVSTIAALVQHALRQASPKSVRIEDPELNRQALELRQEAVKLQDPEQYPEPERQDILNLQRALVERMSSYEFVIRTRAVGIRALQDTLDERRELDELTGRLREVASGLDLGGAAGRLGAALDKLTSIIDTIVSKYEAKLASEGS